MKQLDKHQNIVEELYDLLEEVITPKREIHFMKAFISQLVVNNVEETETEYIMRSFYNKLINGENYNSHEANTTWEYYENYMDELYYEKIGGERPNAGINGLYVWLKTVNTGNLNVKKLIESINKIFEPLNNSQGFSMEIGSDKYIDLDPKNKTVQLLNMKTTRRGGDKSTYETIINAYPKEVIIHDSPLSDSGRTFTIKWVSKSSLKPFITNHSTIKDIENFLEDCGWVLNPRLMKGTIAAIINIAIENGFAEVRNTIDNPGFYYDEESEELLKVNFDINKSTKDSLKESIDMLDELVKYFPNQETKLATCIKWGLVAPFNYAKKQINGSYMPWLYLYGKSGSGKTTMGQILLYLWQTPHSEKNDIGGSSFDTEARVGEKLSLSTFPILVSEPEGALQKPSVMALLKSAIESTTARGKFDNNRYKIIPSFAPVILSANVFLPKQDAIIRRFEILLFSHNEYKDDDISKKFETVFNIGHHDNSKLTKLRGFGDYFYEEISSNPKLLELNWKELADQLIVRAYRGWGLETPEWLLEWNVSATLQDHDDERIEEIRMFLIEEINKATRKVQVWDESTGRPNLEVLGDSEDDVKTANDFDSRVWNVLNENLIPWAGLKHNSRSHKNEVYFTVGMKKYLEKYAEITDHLSNISQLLGWDYKTVRASGSKMSMVVDYEEFLKFLYPTVTDEI